MNQIDVGGFPIESHFLLGISGFKSSLKCSLTVNTNNDNI